MKNKIGFIFIGLNAVKFLFIIVFIVLSIMNKIGAENIALQLICITLLYLIFDVKIEYFEAFLTLIWDFCGTQASLRESECEEIYRAIITL